jgi:bifunctional pyridoxal-dependent enzyme with beta-cystathionase and maltose regulon repressor activities
LRQNTEATYLAWFDARDVIVPVSCSFIAKFVFVQVYFIVGISFQAGTSPGRDGMPFNRLRRLAVSLLCLGKFSPYRFFVQAGVALSDGEPFGGLGFVRLNFACPRTVLLQGF